MIDIMVDVDDVLAPWFDTVDELCAQIWDAGHLRGKCNVWSMWEFYGRTQDEWHDVVISAIQHGLYTTAPPIPGSVEGVNRLRWAGHRVHMVTARGFMANAQEIRSWTPEWLQTFGFGYDSLTFAKDKVAAQEEIGVKFDYAIDDGAHNFRALNEAGVNAYLCDAPHNRAVETPKRIGSMWDFSTLILSETGR